MQGFLRRRVAEDDRGNLPPLHHGGSTDQERNTAVPTIQVVHPRYDEKKMRPRRTDQASQLLSSSPASVKSDGSSLHSFP